MRLKKDLEAINLAGGNYFGYLELDCFRCPPFVMFTNNDDCPVCTYYMRDKAFEVQSTIIWSGLAKQATCILDVGSQGGVYSLIAASLRSDVPIHAFEPNPEGFARLLVNINANDVKNIHPHRTAAGHQQGMFKFEWVPKWLGHISSGGQFARNDMERPNVTQIYVVATPLDDALASVQLGNRPLMKMDVEGAEGLVFMGMKKVLQHKPDILLEAFDPRVCAEITAQTRPLGYNYYMIDETHRRIEQTEALTPGKFMQADKNSLLSTLSLEDVLRIAS